MSIPGSWTWSTLGEACQWGSGGTPLSTNPEYYGGDIPWLLIGDLTDGLVTTSQNTITEAGLRSSSAKWVEPGSVLVAMYGSIGKSGIAGIRLTTNQAIAFTDPTPIDAKFLLYYLHSRREELNRLGKGATQKNISQTVIRAFPFPIAPLGEQRRIVAAIEEQFTRLDAGVAGLERVRANLRRYRASVLKAAVEGKLTEEWRAEHPDLEPASALLERILEERRRRWEETELAKYEKAGKTLPNGWQAKYKKPADLDTSGLPELTNEWRWASLEQLTHRIGDVDHRMPKGIVSGICYISPKDFIGDDQIDFTNAKRISSEDYEALSRKIQPKYDDLLLSRYGTIGLVRRVRTDVTFQASYSTAIIKTLPIEPLTSYLVIALRSQPLQSEMRQSVRASAQPDLGLEYIRRLRVPLPPLSEQYEVVAEVERRLSIGIQAESPVEADLKRATRLRQSILKSAFEGKLVTQDATDEPASALLERIRAERQVTPTRPTGRARQNGKRAEYATAPLFSVEK